MNFSDSYVKVFGKPKYFRLNHFLLTLGLRGLGVLNSADPVLSGEGDYLRSVAADIDREGFCLLDIGANEGDFAEIALKTTRHLQVVSIEPHPRTAARLADRLAPFGARFSVENIGAGAVETELDLYDHSGSEGTPYASFHREVFETLYHSTARKITVLVRPLDSVVSERGLRPIFVKIDTEGSEFEVLSGMKETLASPHLKYILMEFNDISVYARHFVKDFIELLPDFDLYRVLPHGRLLRLAPYSPLFVEMFAYQNLVFIRR